MSSLASRTFVSDCMMSVRQIWLAKTTAPTASDYIDFNLKVCRTRA